MIIPDGIPYALAAIAVSAMAWDAFRRLLEGRAAERSAERSLIEKRLAVEDAFEGVKLEFEGVKLEFEAHKARFAKLTKDTEQSIENLAASMDLAVKKLEGQMAAGELKANMQSGRRIG